MNTRVRATGVRAAVALAVCFAFAFAALFIARPYEPARSGATVVAATIVHGELTAAKSTDGPTLAHAIKRAHEGTGFAHGLDGVLPAAWIDHSIAPAELALVLASDAVAARSGLARAIEQHRSRAPPVSV